MPYQDRWVIVREIGGGGQGKVFQAYDKFKFDLEGEIIPAFKDAIVSFSGAQTPDMKVRDFKQLYKGITKLIEMKDEKNHGALKILHEPNDARDSNLAYERIKKEIVAMSKVSHSNLIEILDSDKEGKWLVSKYYPLGNLAEFLKNQNPFTGNIVNALRAFRPLVTAVAELHKNGIVHRDIKPENIFLDFEGNLILGDFGLVYFIDDRQTRISATFENVGSRDWMPGWAYGCKIEDLKPSFDVFSLGKILWRMISDIPILRLWYFDEHPYDLSKRFPDARSISYLNAFFRQCIVEREDKCLPTAMELLDRVDEFLWYIDINTDGPGQDIVRRCKVCGRGNYYTVANQDLTAIGNFGLEPRGTGSFKIFSCGHCGHVQLFYLTDGKLPQAWQ
jgi:serine/threonine protein kinase